MSVPTQSNSRSSVFISLSAETRAALDRAIVNAAPPTYRECHEKYALAADAITYSSFWRYASRLRRKSEIINLAELTSPEDQDLPALMPRLVLHKLFAALTHEEATPAVISQLTNSYSTLLSAHMKSSEWERKKYRHHSRSSPDEIQDFLECRAD